MERLAGDALAGLPAPYAAKDLAGLLPERKLRRLELQTYFGALRAYIYGYPLVNGYIAAYKVEQAIAGQETMPDLKVFNELVHANRLAGPTETAIPTPNNDTMYSGAALNLTAEPLVLTVPEIKGRYYSFQLMDAYTSTAGYVGTRTTGTKAGSYVIAGPGWDGQLKQKMKVLRCPTPYAWLLARTLLLCASDMKNVESIQQQYKLQPLSVYEGRKPPRLNVEKMTKPAPEDDMFGFFRTLGLALQFNPPVLPQDAGMVKVLRRLGYAKDWKLDTSKVPAAKKTIMAQAARDGRELIDKLTRMSGSTENGWMRMIPGIGDSGRMYIIRAAVAKKGLGACTAEEASYRTANVDENDQPMTGANSYELRFPGSPPAKGFWSLSMYDFETHLLVDNPIKRYSIGDRTAGLVKGKDGSLAIRIQHKKPQKEGVNWLPAPKGRFYLVLRLYIPTRAYLEGKYKLPGVKKL